MAHWKRKRQHLMNWNLIPGDSLSPVIIHVPHASTHIPDHIARHLLLSAQELRQELDLMTDGLTDQLARLASQKAKVTPWIFENTLSRLVFDPERFPDETEVMNQVGMGVVYSKTSDQRPLRDISQSESQKIVDTYFKPYSLAFQALVTERLEALGHVVIIDLHSYPVVASEYELYKDLPRPAVCLGVDAFHTSEALVDLAKRELAELGDIYINTPFMGTYVPLEFYGKEPKVQSIMLELRRDTFLSDGVPGSSFETTALAITRVIDSLEGGEG
jgi:N-formylglutamate deformylase